MLPTQMGRELSQKERVRKAIHQHVPSVALKDRMEAEGGSSAKATQRSARAQNHNWRFKNWAGLEGLVWLSGKSKDFGV